LPGHVLLAVHEAGRRYILDPFGGGKLLDKHHCAGYLAAHELPYSEEYLCDASDTQMFLRQVGNLIHSCKLRGRWRDARNLAQVQTVLLRN
jgi:regulator of sirC expression with transglutaminase-like and TPR domain